MTDDFNYLAQSMEIKPNSQPFLSGHGQDASPPTYQPTRSDHGNGDSQWDVGLIFGTLRRKWPTIVGVTMVITALSALVIVARSSSTQPLYEGSFQLLVEPVTVDDQSARLFLRAQQSGESVDVDQSRLDYETQIRILQSQRLLSPVVEKLKSRYPELNYDLLAADLALSRVTYKKDGKEEGTKLLEITYKASAPETVINVLNALADAYLRYSLKERQTSIRQGIRFIEDQLPQLRQRVGNVQRQVEQIRRQNVLTDPDAQGQKFLEQLSQIDLQRLDTRAKIGEAQANYAALKRQFDLGHYTIILGERPDYQKLLEQSQDLKGQVAVESARSQPDNPILQALQQRQQNVQSLLRQEAEQALTKAADQLTVLEARNQLLSESRSVLSQQIQRLPAISRQYTNLQRELQVATDSLNKFLAKREALQIDAAQQEVPWELTTPPALNRDDEGNPINTAAVSKVRLLAIALILGLLLGVGVAFLQEIMEDVFHNPDDLKRVSTLPVLGVIPRLQDTETSGFSWLQRLPLHKLWSRWRAPAALGLGQPSSDQTSALDSPTLFTEAFYSFCTNLQSLITAAPTKSLVISSPGNQDGKSTIAIHLAQAAAATGQKVLLVDANLRSPKIHEYLQIANTRGFGDLSDAQLDFESLLHHPRSDSGLFILTAGKSTQDPVQRLSAPNIQTSMQKFAETFDLVIYDTPSFLQFADANLMAARTDGLILVACLERTTYSIFRRALGNMKVSSIPVLGVVVNQAQEI